MAELDPTAGFLLAAAAIILVCQTCGALMRRLGQPPVVGEILGGLLLGPSVLGQVWPQARDALFPAAVDGLLEAAAQLGLVTFMFVLGLEWSRGGTGVRGRTATAVAVASFALPFAAGALFALATGGSLAGTAAQTSHVLFFGLALSITAVPVLARILQELGLSGTRLGGLAMTGAIVGDALAWVVLAAILTGAGAGDPREAAVQAGLMGGLVFVAVFVVRPAHRPLLRWMARSGNDHLLLPVLITGALLFAGAAQAIGMLSVLGAFLFGACVPHDHPGLESGARRLLGFVSVVLLPLFFAGVGLSTSVGLLGGSAGNWLLLPAVLAAASLPKVLGAGVAGRLTGLPGREALRLGALMNCRGITELVVATIGLQHGLVNDLGFTLLVLVALITTASSGPVVRALGSGRPEEGAAKGAQEQRPVPASTAPASCAHCSRPWPEAEGTAVAP
jgi:Kef-type K+ transport system membrane component KefB